MRLCWCVFVLFWGFFIVFFFGFCPPQAHTKTQSNQCLTEMVTNDWIWMNQTSPNPNHIVFVPKPKQTLTTVLSGHESDSQSFYVLFCAVTMQHIYLWMQSDSSLGKTRTFNPCFKLQLSTCMPATCWTRPINVPPPLLILIRPTTHNSLCSCTCRCYDRSNKRQSEL